MREFTIEDAINIQTEQLALWEKHLVASTFNAIKARTIISKHKVSDKVIYIRTTFDIRY